MSESSQTDELPRGAFMKGVAIGAGIHVPLLFGTLWLLLPLHLRDQMGFEKVLFLVATFAGIPAALTAGGVARVCRQAALLPSKLKFLPVRLGATHFAIAGIALLFLAAIPVGAIPETVLGILWMGAVGAMAGALSGALIGAWASRTP
jgi:hypothetical protein